MVPRFLFTYLIFALAIIFVIYFLRKRKREIFPAADASSRQKFRSKPDKWSWVQVYDTDSVEDARGVVARLEEEELDCILYEQGRKDIHGNQMKGYGIAVPRTATARAQNIISRMPV